MPMTNHIAFCSFLQPGQPDGAQDYNLAYDQRASSAIIFSFLFTNPAQNRIDDVQRDKRQHEVYDHFHRASFLQAHEPDGAQDDDTADDQHADGGDHMCDGFRRRHCAPSQSQRWRSPE